MFPLTHPQKRIVANQLIYNESKFAHMYGMVCIKGRCAKKLSDAINAAISRFDCLRIGFVRKEKQILQYIAPCEHEDIESRPSDFDFFSERLSLFDGKMYRFYIVEKEGHTAGYYFILHHAIVDAYTISLIIRFIDDYLNERALDKAPQSFLGFVESEREYLQSEEFRSDLDFFNNRLLRSMNFKYTPDFSLGCDRVENALTDEQSLTVLTYCKQRKISVFKLFFAALFLLMYIEDKRTIQTISTTHHNRDTEGLREAGGMFASTIPVVQVIDFSLSFVEFLDIVSVNLDECLARHKFPLDIALTGTRPANSFDLNLFEVLFTSIPFGSSDEVYRFSPGEDLAYLDFKLNPNSRPKGSSIELAVDFNMKRYTRMQAGRFLRSLVDIAFMFVMNGEELLADRLPLEPDLLTMIFGEARPQSHMGQNHMFRPAHVFEPDRIALVDDKEAITYKEMRERVDAVANFLDSLYEAGHIIGVINERSAWYVIAMLGVLKAGKAFMPLDLNLPSQRLESMIRQARVETVLAFSDEAGFPGGIEAINIKNIEPGAEFSILASRLAYILFTSGSSGAPKGVMVGRQGLASLLCALGARLGIARGDRFSAYCDFNFDVSIAEILLPLTTASTLYIANEAQRHDLRRLYDFFHANNINHVFLPTGVGEAFIRHFPECAISTLILFGEKMAYRGNTKYRVFNGYGPAEFTIFSHVGEIPGDAPRTKGTVHMAGRTMGTVHMAVGAPCAQNSYTIGPPLDNVLDMIVDSSGDTPGAGELVLVGEQAAFGYLNDYRLTTERFVAVMDEDGNKYRPAYKTSDRIMRDCAGNIYFLARMDRQIKHHGFRIEPEEIEYLAVESMLTEQAVCIYDGSKIILFVKTHEAYDKESLMRYLTERLPVYALPGRIIEVPDFPRTNNDKIDYRACAKMAVSPDLALPGKRGSRGDHSSGPGKTERQLLQIISAFIPQAGSRRQALSTDDNIFTAGIDSMGVLQVMLEVEQRFKCRLHFSDFLLYPTIRALSRQIIIEGNKGGKATGVIQLREGKGRALVLVFDISRDLISYHHLLKELKPGRPVYGISADFVPPQMSLEEYSGFLASALLSRAQTSEGTAVELECYDLLGYSSGGIPALEIAKALGENAGTVYLVDTPNYKQYPECLNLKIVLTNTFSIMSVYGATGFLSFVRKQLKGLGNRIYMANESKKLISMIREFEPETPGCPVVLFATSEMAERTDDRLGWQSLVQNDMIIKLKGGHVRVMKDGACIIARRIESDFESTVSR